MISADYYYTKEFKELLNKYETCEHEQETSVFCSTEYCCLASYYYFSDKTEKALSVLNEGLSFYPDSVDMLVLKIHVLLKQHKNTEEIRTMLEEHELMDEDARSYVSSFLLITDKRYKEANNAFKKVYKEMPLEEEEKDAQALSIAWAFYHAGQFTYARYWMEKVKNHDKNDYLELYGHIILAEGKFVKSEKVFQKLIDKNPHVARYWEGLAHSQYGSEKFSEASTNCDYALAINPEDEVALFLKGNIMFMMDNYPEALKFFKRYSQQLPDDGGCLYYQAKCLLEMEKEKEALDALLESSRLLEKYPEYRVVVPLYYVYRDIALLLEADGKYEEALSFVDKIDDHEGNKLELMLMRSRLRLEVKYASKLKKEFEDEAEEEDQ